MYANSDQDKAALRSLLRQRRSALSEEIWQRSSEDVCRSLLALPVLVAASRVALFWPLVQRRELDLRPLDSALRALGKTLYYPVMHSSTLNEAPDDHGSNSPAAWGFARTASAEDLYPRRGLYEPRATCPSAGPAELEVIVTPGLGLDDAGYRLGYGAGFYDRVLVRFAPPAFVVGVCYASERSSALPRQAHDRPVDWIVTENESGAVVR